VIPALTGRKSTSILRGEGCGGTGRRAGLGPLGRVPLEVRGPPPDRTNVETGAPRRRRRPESIATRMSRNRYEDWAQNSLRGMSTFAEISLAPSTSDRVICPIPSTARARAGLGEIGGRVSDRLSAVEVAGTVPPRSTRTAPGISCVMTSTICSGRSSSRASLAHSAARRVEASPPGKASRGRCPPSSRGNRKPVHRRGLRRRTREQRPTSSGRIAPEE